MYTCTKVSGCLGRVTPVKLKKCSIFQPKLRYLGYIVAKDGIKTDPDKVAAVMKCPVPRSASEVGGSAILHVNSCKVIVNWLLHFLICCARACRGC